MPWRRKSVQEYGRSSDGLNVEGYLLPHDEKEQDRLDFLYQALKFVLCSDDLIHVPHPQDGRFIDLGCGAGIWAIEVAEKYPAAYVLGVDIASIQPPGHPTNCFFLTPFDYQSRCIMGEAQWDVVNLRMGSGSVVAWPLLYKRIWSTLSPGGWVEQWEIDFEPRSDIKSLSDTPLHQWYQQTRFATAASGRPIDHCAGQTQMWLRQAGFKAINHQEIVLPPNQWNQDASDPAAVWYAMAYFEIIESMCVGPLRKVFCLTEKEVHSIIFHARQQVLDGTVPTFYTIHIYKAQKR